MQLRAIYLSVLASALAVQAAPGQIDVPPPSTTVSLTATTSLETVGRACLPFHCQPLYTMGRCGESVTFGVSASAGSPYLLFAGAPVSQCQSFLGIDAALALWSPILTLDFGFVSSTDQRWPSVIPPVSTCDVGVAVVAEQLPAHVPPGTDIRFQALSFVVGATGQAQPGFSRAIEIRCR